jgi:hypothetical protein
MNQSGLYALFGYRDCSLKKNAPQNYVLDRMFVQFRAIPGNPLSPFGPFSPRGPVSPEERNLFQFSASAASVSSKLSP